MTETVAQSPAHSLHRQDHRGKSRGPVHEGRPRSAKCGFSSLVVQVLDHIGVDFVGVDVLQDEQLRTGIKAFSDWPTIPQLYVKGEFVGGSDIVREMFQSGELKTLLAGQGLVAA